MRIMIRLNKIIAFALGLMFCLIVSGCATKNDQNLTSDMSTITQNDNEGEDAGAIILEEEFDIDEQDNSEGENFDTNEEDNKTTSSATGNGNSTSHNSCVSSSTDDNKKSPSDNNKDENTSSDTVSQPSQNNDGIVELPFDKW